MSEALDDVKQRMASAVETADLLDIKKSLASLGTDLEALNDYWQNSREKLPDGRKVWPPDFDAFIALQKELTDNPHLSRIPIKSLVIEEENATIETLELNDIWDELPKVLGRFRNLKSLELIKGCFSDISVLGDLTKLENLALDTTQFKGSFPLRKLKNLKSFTLGWCIAGIDLQDLAGLVGLEKVDVRSNNIKNLMSLEALVNLKILNIGNIRLPLTEKVDWAFISKLTKLETISILDLKIADISFLLDLPNLKKCWVMGNTALETKEGQEVIAKLKARGVEVLGA